MVGAGSGASMGAEEQVGHVWGVPMVGPTYVKINKYASYQ